ncbi:MAG: peptidase C1 [Bacteroidia bacterium]
MPIRIVPDQPEKNSNRPSQNSNRSGSRRSSGGSPLLAALIGFLFKKPKLLIPILIIAALLYFGKGCLFSGDNASVVPDIAQLFTGAEFNEAEYDKAEVFEPLADNIKNPLPEKVSLEEFCPDRKNQGKQGSCVGWSSGYAARTILEARATGKDPNQVAFSPASLYNQISLPNCQGAYIINAMKTMKTTGLLPWSDLPYDENTCDVELSRAGYQKAANYRMRGFNRLTPNGDPRGVDLLAIKQNLAQGAPVVIGMMVGGSFMTKMNGKESWRPYRSDYNMSGFGGHAMCVIGYDDYKNGGSFQIMNSWGEKWGRKGLAWVNYSDFKHFTKEAYGLYPMGNANSAEPAQFKASFGLIDQSNKQEIQLEKASSFYFRTKQAIPKLSKFKIEVTNNVACYTYIFGQETDQSSYVLFPYTKKHSPYCGITGTRQFPKDASLQADEIGQQDFFAIVISREPLDYDKFNQMINGGRGSNYLQKIYNAFGNQIDNGAQLGMNRGQISVVTDAQEEGLIVIVIGVDKR